MIEYNAVNVVIITMDPGSHKGAYLQGSDKVSKTAN